MSALNDFLDSLRSSDRRFREDFDLYAGRQLEGLERKTALRALLDALKEGQDPRVPRALAALQAREHLMDLYMAIERGTSSARVESALAVVALGGEPEDALPVLDTVLRDPSATLEAQVRAILGLEALDLPQARTLLLRTVLRGGGPNLRGNAFSALMRQAGLAGMGARHSRLDALYQLMTSDQEPVRRAYVSVLQDLIADAARGDAVRWSTPVDVQDPQFEALRQRLLRGGAAGDLEPLRASELVDLDSDARLLLQAWAVHLLDRGHPGALDSARALQVAGLEEA